MKYRRRHRMAFARWFPAIVIGGALLAWTSAGRAEITSWKLSNGPQSAAGGVLVDWSREIADEYKLCIKRGQSGGAGQILMDFTTNTPDDPKITSINQVENDSDSSWIGYSIKVTLVTTSELTAYLISSQAVTNPGDWTATITQQLAPTGQNGSGQYEYVGIIDLAGGPPVGNGDELDFTYLLTFAGSTSYHAIQDITPVPVPESSVFDMLAGAIVMLLLGNNLGHLKRGFYTQARTCCPGKSRDDLLAGIVVSDFLIRRKFASGQKDYTTARTGGCIL